MARTSIKGSVVKQQSLSCGCGRTPVVAKGLCASCYSMRRHDEEYYAGLREKVLERDGHRCQVCGRKCSPTRSSATPQMIDGVCVNATNESYETGILVHHRQPGKSTMSLMITLCVGCHAKVHKRTVLDDPDAPELLRILWREQHPEGVEQFVLKFSIEQDRPAPGCLFDLDDNTATEPG